MHCPRCQSLRIIKNGRMHTGKPKWMCKACTRHFVAEPKWRRISDDTPALIDKRLREKISLAGIARVRGGAERWLPAYVNAKYAKVPRIVQVPPKKRGA